MRYDSGWSINAVPFWKRHGYASEASYRKSRERYNQLRRQRREESGNEFETMLKKVMREEDDE